MISNTDQSSQVVVRDDATREFGSGTGFGAFRSNVLGNRLIGGGACRGK